MTAPRDADRALDKAALRRALQQAHPWLATPDLGPRSVVAGECDVCGEEARLVQPCGPPPAQVRTPDWALGRRCAAAVGTDGWCHGHHDEAVAALAWLAELPEEADQVARVWWLATGEVRPDPALVRQAMALTHQVGDRRPGVADDAGRRTGSEGAAGS